MWDARFEALEAELCYAQKQVRGLRQLRTETSTMSDSNSDIVSGKGLLVLRESFSYEQLRWSDVLHSYLFAFENGNSCGKPPEQRALKFDSQICFYMVYVCPFQQNDLLVNYLLCEQCMELDCWSEQHHWKLHARFCSIASVS